MHYSYCSDGVNGMDDGFVGGVCVRWISDFMAIEFSSIFFLFFFRISSL